MTIVYLAVFEYGIPCLSSIEMVKETDKMVMVKKGTEKILLGKYGIVFTETTRLSKDHYHVFKSLEEAVAWLRSKAAAYVDSKFAEYEKAVETRHKLQNWEAQP